MENRNGFVEKHPFITTLGIFVAAATLGKLVIFADHIMGDHLHLTEMDQAWQSHVDKHFRL